MCVKLIKIILKTNNFFWLNLDIELVLIVAMKKYLLLFTFFSCFTCLYAQRLKPELICTGSGIISNGTTNISWTIGEGVISTMNAPSIQLTNGIAQPDYKITAVMNNLSQIDISLFPNPTKDILVLQTKRGQLKDAM